MLDRRRALQSGVAVIGVSALAPSCAIAQGLSRTKVRYNEVVRSILFAPAYVAISKGFFDEAGLEIALVTGQGGDKSMAAPVQFSRCCADWARDGNLRPQQRIAAESAYLLWAHLHGWFYADRA